MITPTEENGLPAARRGGLNAAAGLAEDPGLSF
jgi:hypothetical protein